MVIIWNYVNYAQIMWNYGNNAQIMWNYVNYAQIMWNALDIFKLCRLHNVYSHFVDCIRYIHSM